MSNKEEEAVRSYIFEMTAEQIKTANAGRSEEDLEAMVGEALEWARHN